MNSVQKMLSEKGKLIFIVDKFKFSFHKLLQNGQHRYKCTKRGCTANLKVLENEDIVWTSCNLEHNHDADEENKIERQIISNNLKRKATENLCERPSKLLHSYLRENNTNAITTKDVTYIKHNIFQARASLRPNLPRSRQEVHDILKDMDVKTYEGNTFLQVNNAEKGILLFSTEDNLKFLSKSTTFYVDGTFSYCTQFFYQFFTIHVMKNNHYVPLVFTLLKDKKQESYVDIFRIIDNYCLTYNSEFNLESIYVDFEIAIHNAINDVWPMTKVRGCRFHLGQSWYRTIKKFGLSSEYVQNTEIGQYLKYIFGLPFLDPQSVGDCFSNELAEIQPINEKLTKFNDYLVENYIDNDSTFPPEIWAEKSNSIYRTTNSCESFHSKFNSQFYSPHPNIFNFLNILYSIQSDTKIIIRSSNITKPHRKEIRDKIQFLEDEIQKYDTGVHTRFQYIKILANKYRPRKIV